MRELRRIWVGRGEFIKREGEKTDEWWRGEERGASYGNEREKMIRLVQFLEYFFY